MALANGAQPADNEEIAPKTLMHRMAAIRAEAHSIGKEPIKMQNKERTKEWTIQAHTIEGVLHGVRTLFDKHGVLMIPNLVEFSYSGNRCDARYEFYFENFDDPADSRTISWAGAGTDNSDKALAKAGTNALKEMLKKVFLITDREDAKEEEDRTEFQTNDGAARADLEREKETTRQALEQWAKAFKLAVQNCKNRDELARLQRDNKASLMNEQTPSVTRDFFIDLIEAKKKELPE